MTQMVIDGWSAEDVLKGLVPTRTRWSLLSRLTGPPSTHGRHVVRACCNSGVSLGSGRRPGTRPPAVLVARQTASSAENKASSAKADPNALSLREHRRKCLPNQEERTQMGNEKGVEWQVQGCRMSQKGTMATRSRQSRLQAHYHRVQSFFKPSTTLHPSRSMHHTASTSTSAAKHELSDACIPRRWLHSVQGVSTSCRSSRMAGSNKLH